MAESSNFVFLSEHDPVFFQLASSAERVFASDPNTTLIKLRQLGEAMAQDLASRAGIEFDANTTQSDLLYKLSREIQLERCLSKENPTSMAIRVMITSSRSCSDSTRSMIGV
mgnify:CR=1 FL=1